MGQKVVIEGRNELAKNGTNRIFSTASVTSVGHLKTDGQIVDGNGDVITTDASTRTITTTTYEHHEIHAGSHYFVAGFTTLAEDGELVFGITTPDTTEQIHILTEVEGTNQTELYVYEDSTFTGGAAVTPINNDRNSTNASSLVLVSAPTVTDLGDILVAQSSGRAGVTPAKSEAGNVKREEEIILKRNTLYIFKAISRGDDNIVSYRANWYDHTPKG